MAKASMYLIMKYISFFFQISPDNRFRVDTWICSRPSATSNFFYSHKSILEPSNLVYATAWRWIRVGSWSFYVCIHLLPVSNYTFIRPSRAISSIAIRLHRDPSSATREEQGKLSSIEGTSTCSRCSAYSMFQVLRRFWCGLWDRRAREAQYRAREDRRAKVDGTEEKIWD